MLFVNCSQSCQSSQLRENKQLIPKSWSGFKKQKITIAWLFSQVEDHKAEASSRNWSIHPISYLQHCISNPLHRLVLSNRCKVEHILVTNMRRVGIAVHVDGPFTTSIRTSPCKTNYLVISGWPVPMYFPCKWSQFLENDKLTLNRSSELYIPLLPFIHSSTMKLMFKSDRVWRDWKRQFSVVWKLAMSKDIMNPM